MTTVHFCENYQRQNRNGHVNKMTYDSISSSSECVADAVKLCQRTHILTDQFLGKSYFLEVNCSAGSSNTTEKSFTKFGREP